MAGVLAATGLAHPAMATWSIVMADAATREVSVGTVTCLNNFDLLRIVPVVVVGEGAGACQAAGDFNGIRRPVMFNGLRQDRTPASILVSLAGIGGHASRQYGIVDTEGEAITFTGTATSEWTGGITGSVGTLHYAIQGNILAGPCVVPAIEAAIVETDGDMADRMMAGMLAARMAGGDGRCSCAGSPPTACGCPPPAFDKSGHIGGMIVARVGDADDPACTSGGCADGDYFMRLNVAFQPGSADDPVDQLTEAFDAWRLERADRIDALVTLVEATPEMVASAQGAGAIRIVPRTASGAVPATPARSIAVTHAADSAGIALIGSPQPLPDGTWLVPLTGGATDATGTDRFRIVLDDGIAQYERMPQPVVTHLARGDVDGDGEIGFPDLLGVLSAWGGCGPPLESCTADLDGDGDVDFVDLTTMLTFLGDTP